MRQEVQHGVPRSTTEGDTEKGAEVHHSDTATQRHGGTEEDGEISDFGRMFYGCLEGCDDGESEG